MFTAICLTSLALSYLASLLVLAFPYDDLFDDGFEEEI